MFKPALKTGAILGLLIFSGVLLSACAIKETNVAFTPPAASTAARLSGAELVSVVVAVKDERPGERDVISRKINGFGSELAAIRTKRPVADIMKEGMEAELKARGFKVGSGSKQVDMNVLVFFNTYDNGLFAGSASAEAQFGIVVREGRKELFKGDSLGNAKQSVQIANGSNAEETLHAALKDAMNKLFANPEFTKALLVTR